MNDLEKKIFDVVEKAELGSLATIGEDGKPWVRTVTVWASNDLALRFCTDAASRKVRHIERNPEVHLTCTILNPPDDSVYFQVQGLAQISKDPQEKKDSWKEGWRRYFSGPDDPNYVIVIVRPYRIEYNGPGAATPEIWEPRTR